MRSPRIDQVNELTRGLRLPVPPVAVIHLDVVIDALRRALDCLVSDYGVALAEKNESELNSLLQARLSTLCTEEKLLSQLVACVVRGGESVSFDGRRLELRPDLGIYLTDRNRKFPLIVECKIIDGDHGQGVDLYCRNGIRRFVQGEYAWASSQGLMLAYVRDDSLLQDLLLPYLRSAAGNKPDPFLTEAIPCLDGAPSGAVWVSCHGREFGYVGNVRGRPGPIGISHLWIKVPGGVSSRKRRAGEKRVRLSGRSSASRGAATISSSTKSAATASTTTSSRPSR